MQALPANLLAKVQQFSLFAKIYVYLVRKTSSVAELFAREIRLIRQQHDIKTTQSLVSPNVASLLRRLSCFFCKHVHNLHYIYCMPFVSVKFL